MKIRKWSFCLSAFVLTAALCALPVQADCGRAAELSDSGQCSLIAFKDFENISEFDVMTAVLKGSRSGRLISQDETWKAYPNTPEGAAAEFIAMVMDKAPAFWLIITEDNKKFILDEMADSLLEDIKHTEEQKANFKTLLAEGFDDYDDAVNNLCWEGFYSELFCKISIPEAGSQVPEAQIDGNTAYLEWNQNTFVLKNENGTWKVDLMGLGFPGCD